LREQQVEQHGILIIEIQCLEPLGSTRVVGLAEFWEASQNRSRSMSPEIKPAGGSSCAWKASSTWSSKLAWI
jgi:hypothetical protein